MTNTNPMVHEFINNEKSVRKNLRAWFNGFNATKSLNSGYIGIGNILGME